MENHRLIGGSFTDLFNVMVQLTKPQSILQAAIPGQSG